MNKQKEIYLRFKTVVQKEVVNAPVYKLDGRQ